MESIEAQKGKNDSYQMRFGDKVVKGGWQATSDGFYDDVNLPPGVAFSKAEHTGGAISLIIKNPPIAKVFIVVISFSSFIMGTIRLL